ncbi:hypothetical protein [Streptomyces sp. NPDC088757]
MTLVLLLENHAQARATSFIANFEIHTARNHSTESSSLALPLA